MVRLLVRLGTRTIRSCVFVFCGQSILFVLALSSYAQTSTQQYVYANAPSSPTTTSTLAEFSKNSQAGGLSEISNSPVADHLEGGRLAVDALGRFLFVLNRTTSGISMYQINSSTGALNEVPNSPFSAGF